MHLHVYLAWGECINKWLVIFCSGITKCLPLLFSFLCFLIYLRYLWLLTRKKNKKKVLITFKKYSLSPKANTGWKRDKIYEKVHRAFFKFLIFCPFWWKLQIANHLFTCMTILMGPKSITGGHYSLNKNVTTCIPSIDTVCRAFVSLVSLCTWQRTF